MAVKRELTIELLREFEPFANLPDTHLTDILKKTRLTQLPAGRMLFKRGELSKLNYYLVSGSLDLSDREFNITHVTSDSQEARYALNSAHPHSQSAITKDEVNILTVDRDHLDLVITWEQAGDYAVSELSDQTPEERDWMHCLLESKLFTQIPPTHIQQLFANFQQIDAKSGQIILREGEDGEHFYVLKTGSVRVTRNTPFGTEELAILEPGDFFGEEALVGDAVRNATITMLSDGELMCLDKGQFTRLLRDSVVRTISLDALRNFQATREVRLVDVRLRTEFRHTHHEGAECIPLKELRERLPALPYQATYVITSDGGRRSELGAYLFMESGLNAFLLDGSAHA